MAVHRLGYVWLAGMKVHWKPCEHISVPMTTYQDKVYEYDETLVIHCEICDQDHEIEIAVS